MKCKRPATEDKIRLRREAECGEKHPAHSQCQLAALDGMSVRAALHSLLNKHERALGSRFPFANVIRRVRGCLTLMLAAAANATATPAPGRLHRFTNGFSRRPFHCPAHAAGVAGCRKFFVPSNHCWLANGFRRGVRREKVSGLLTLRFAPRGGERALRLRSSFQISGFRIFPVASQSGHLRCDRLMLAHPKLPTGLLRAKCPHCSARTAGRTHHFAPAPLAAASARADGPCGTHRGLLPLISTAAK